MTPNLSRTGWLPALAAALLAFGCAHGAAPAAPAGTSEAQPARKTESEAERRAAEARIEAMMAPRKLEDPAAAPTAAAPTAAAKPPATAAPTAARDVVVVGKAADAASGAVVQTDDGRVLYVGGLDAWPDALLGKRVEVRGSLARRKLAPDPTPGPGGEQRHGMVGESEVIDGARWRVVEAGG